ncbi:helix-turn-helix domain-containing protein [Clostridium disporicum]|uniref:helix-turn-helix domain-containing protein n=1 Tax=Clostridium disporicum TaxID=84024 RepID=UPI0034A59DB3
MVNLELYLLTVKDVAERLKVNVNYVYELIKKGHIEALRLGSMKITNAELDRFISSASGNDFSNLDNVVPLETLQNKN